MKITSLVHIPMRRALLSPEVRVSSAVKNDAVHKLVVGVSLPLFGVSLRMGGRTYPDVFNLAEPLDRKTHVFILPEEPKKTDKATLLYSPFGKKIPLRLKKRIRFADLQTKSKQALEQDADSGWRVLSETRETVAPGLTLTVFHMKTKKDAPVVASLLTVDPLLCTLYVGTADDGYAAKNARATIPDMIAAAEQNGQTVFAAVNADFFDMFGDHHPSGLCVKNGRVVANGDSLRPFIGVKNDGTPVLTDLEKDPGLLGDLRHAAAGMQLILKDGEPFDTAPGEPFGFTPHPRTAAALTGDGKILLLEVDGRIPAHSNGATLTDLSLFLKQRKAVTALNLDGGGSSAVYTKNRDGGFDLRTVPADLFRPNDRLIRKDYNAILITKA